MAWILKNWLFRLADIRAIRVACIFFRTKQSNNRKIGNLLMMVCLRTSVLARVASQPLSSSGQSCTPSHHLAASMQLPLVGQSLWPTGQGLHRQAQSSVRMGRWPDWGQGSQRFGWQIAWPPIVHRQCWQSGVSRPAPTGYLPSNQRLHCWLMLLLRYW